MSDERFEKRNIHGQKLTLRSLILGCRGSSGLSLLPGMINSGGVQSTESGLDRFLSENIFCSIKRSRKIMANLSVPLCL